MPCCLSAFQAPIQAKLRPGTWFPGIRNLHRCKEKWEIEGISPEICVQKLVNAITKLAENEKIYLHKVDREKNFVQIYSFTKAEWLDVVEIEFRPGQHSGTEAMAVSFSSGFLPVWIPLSFFFNMVFFFIPFYDNKFNQQRLKRIKESMELLDDLP